MRLPQNYGWIGVDVGTHAVKLAQTVRDGANVRLHRAAVIQRTIAWSGDDGFALEQPITSYPEIRAALECGDFRGRNAICALPMNACRLRSLNVPPGSDQDRRTIIADELAEDWGELQTPMEFDYWEMEPARAEKNTDAFNVSVLASSRLWISQMWHDCRRSGLDCWAIDGLPLAMARSVGLAGGFAGGQRALAVDWGYSNTTLCIVGEDRPLYSRRVHNCAFGTVLDSIMKEFEITLDEAQFLVESDGVSVPGVKMSGDPQTSQTITDAVADTLDELLSQITRTLQFTETQRRHLQPAAVWLMGGGASMKNIGPYLANVLPVPVHVWNLPPASMPISCAAGSRAALFAGAAALSALVWRAA
ncbi:MAG TPA: pilus assembly protein PilM [Lacipirellulaceae bacterium]|nr:pilus assembly protein PilM [Lacipirellulaceae bacterium]